VVPVHAVLTVGLAATGVFLLAGPRPRSTERRPPPSKGDEEGLLRRLRPLLVLLSFLGGWLVVGGTPGLLGGAVAAALAWRVLGRTERPGARRRREELERDLPVAVHLLGACLVAGAATSTALEDVAGALPGAVADELLVVRHRLALGVDPATVWGDLAGHPQLGPLGRSLVRAHRSGASVREAVALLAVELGAQSRARTEVLARGVEVRAAAPLGLCFLPAFVLLGVVPMVVGVFSAMRLFG
jgi:Flp pilus assembly protein TadB